MTASMVEAAIHELMDLAWNVVHDLLEDRGLLGDGFDVGEYQGVHSWAECLTPLHRGPLPDGGGPVRGHQAGGRLVFHYDVLGADDPKSFFTLA